MVKFVFILVGILVIYGVFAFQNPFNNAKITAVRAMLAIVVGWVVVILTSIVIGQIDMSAMQATIDLADIQETNKARKLGALFFGWAYPLIFIELIWFSVLISRYVKNKNSINLKTLKFKKI